MKKYLIITILSMMTITLSAQEILVNSIKEKPYYNLTGAEIQKDGNGDVCALLTIYFNEKDALFEGAYVVGSKSVNSYYQVYLAGGASKIVIKHDDYIPVSIIFSDYGIGKLQSNKAYEITLVGDKTQNAISKDFVNDNFVAMADSSDAETQYKLGKSYYIGLNDEQDYGKAIYWFRKSAEQGNINAIYNIGLCYYYGHGVEQEYNKATEYFRTAANSGHAMAQYKLANCLYFYNKKSQDDVLEAIKWFESAASQNIILAKNNVALIYLMTLPTI